ncbi:hypothetical protein R6Q59_023853 [Mikania micrantha]
MPGVIRIGRDYRDEGAAPRPGWHGKRAWWPIRVTEVWSWWSIKGLVWATTGVFSAQGGDMLCPICCTIGTTCVTSGANLASYNLTDVPNAVLYVLFPGLCFTIEDEREHASI